MRDFPEMTLDQQGISSEVRFYTIEDLRKMLGWSEMTLQKLFNDPDFYQKVQDVMANELYKSLRNKSES